MDHLLQIAPEKVEEAWPLLKGPLQQVRDETGASWQPEDVRAEVESGSAVLLGRFGDQGLEFVVLKAKPAYDGRTLLVWIAWSSEGSAIDRHWDQIKEMGQLAECVHVEFWTPRKGFERLAPRLNVEPWMTVYRGRL